MQEEQILPLYFVTEDNSDKKLLLTYQLSKNDENFALLTWQYNNPHVVNKFSHPELMPILKSLEENGFEGISKNPSVTSMEIVRYLIRHVAAELGCKHIELGEKSTNCFVVCLRT
jgi:hypothetical protein